jgi:polysaccharide deacetylase family sporulation protein PdaB
MDKTSGRKVLTTMKYLYLRIFLISLLLMNVNVSAEMIKRREVEPTGKVVWEVPTQKKVIALTFDDGPSPIYTPQILALLRQYNAHATFFTIGSRVNRYPHITQQVIQAGHDIGNHTMTHPYENRNGFDRLRTEFLNAHHVLQQYQPNQPKLFRPPGGYIDDALLAEVNSYGYTVVLWSYHQDTRDWSSPGVQVIANHIISHARNGDIVLLHDGGGNRTQTVEALKIILPILQKQGYEFVRVSELLRYRSVH